MNIDLMTVNAHKIYGPKGVGALFLKEGVKIDPLLHGGGHEFGLRSSTENVPGVVGFAKTVELRNDEMKPETQRLKKLQNRLIKGVLEIEETRLNGHPTKRLPNIANFIFSFIEGESLVLLLNDEGVATSTGSACSSKSLEPSHVLLALGLKPEEIHGSLRLSLGKYTTEEDIDYVLEILPRDVEKLRKMSPLYKS
jgi:cysteine desulfurase